MFVSPISTCVSCQSADTSVIVDILLIALNCFFLVMKRYDITYHIKIKFSYIFLFTTLDRLYILRWIMNVIYKWKLNKTSVSCEQGNCLELHRCMHSICQLCVEYSSLFRQIISLQVILAILMLILIWPQINIKSDGTSNNTQLRLLYICWTHSGFYYCRSYWPVFYFWRRFFLIGYQRSVCYLRMHIG